MLAQSKLKFFLRLRVHLDHHETTVNISPYAQHMQKFVRRWLTVRRNLFRLTQHAQIRSFRKNLKMHYLKQCFAFKESYFKNQSGTHLNRRKYHYPQKCLPSSHRKPFSLILSQYGHLKISNFCAKSEKIMEYC